MTSLNQQTPRRKVTVGVDTHKYLHAAVVLDELGARLGELVVPADSGGYDQLERWGLGHGRVVAFGVEGTGSYGAGLASLLRRRGHRVVEVNRPDRRDRRQRGKTDLLDAENAARAVLGGRATALAKSGEGTVEMLRHLKIVKDTAVKARTQGQGVSRRPCKQRTNQDRLPWAWWSGRPLHRSRPPRPARVRDPGPTPCHRDIHDVVVERRGRTRAEPGHPRLGRPPRTPALHPRTHPDRRQRRVPPRRPRRPPNTGAPSSTTTADVPPPVGDEQTAAPATAPSESSASRLGPDGLTGEERERIRAGAIEEGIEVKTRGRLSKDLIGNYRSLHARR